MPVLEDERGTFTPLFTNKITQITGQYFIEQNYSTSKPGVIRGLHAQINAQAKLVRSAFGTIRDVVYCPRQKKTVNFLLNDPTVWLFIPAGLYHGFLSYSGASVHYLVSRPFNPKGQKTIAFDSPSLEIPWEKWFGSNNFIVSAKDRAGERV